MKNIKNIKSYKGKNSYINKRSGPSLNTKLTLLFAIFITIINLSVIFAILSSLIHINNIFEPISNNNITIPLILILFNIIIEVYGKANANKTTIATFISIFTTFILFYLISTISYSFDSSNLLTTLTTLFITLAFSFFITMRLNVVLYGYIKHKTNKKYLWLRNIISLCVSSIIISILLNIGNFQESINLFNIIKEKIIISILLLPILYLIIYILKRKPYYKNNKYSQNNYKNKNYNFKKNNQHNKINKTKKETV